MFLSYLNLRLFMSSIHLCLIYSPGIFLKFLQLVAEEREERAL